MLAKFLVKYTGRILAFSLIVLTLPACIAPAVNETIFPYTIKQDEIDARKPQRLLIAHKNFGLPSKKYLHQYENLIDAAVKDKLESAGYTVVDNAAFKSLWREATRKYGKPYSESTSQLNNAAFKRVISSILNSLQEQDTVDAVVFTDLVEQPVVFQGSSNRLAKWHGVSRRLRNKGSGQIPAEFDWSQTVPAVSLRAIVYATDGTLLFKSLGGLEVSRQLDTRQGRNRFVRREKLFDRNNYTEQGVGLALHPFVEMTNYTKK